MSKQKSSDSQFTQAADSARKIDFSLVRKVLAFAAPIALGRQIENVVNMIDIFLVGRISTEAISAYGVARSVTMVVMVSMMAVTTGTFALVAQAIGAGSMENASATAKQSFTLLFLLSIALSLMGFTVTPYLLPALSVGPNIIALGTPFLKVFFAGIPIMMLNYAVINCMYGAGNTRTPFFIGIVSNIVKVCSSYLLIFGIWGFPRMGVTGAAMGGVMGRSIGLLVGFVALYSGRFGLELLPGTSYRPNRNLVTRILRIGIPSAFQGFFRNGSTLIYVKLIALTTSSTEAIAAFSIGQQMERVLRHTSLSYGTTATTFVGQSLGAGEPDEADRRGRTVLVVAVLTAMGLGLPVALLAPSIMGIFTDSPRVVQIGIIYLYAMVLAEPFMGSASVSEGGLRGAGDTIPPLVYTLVSQWLIRLPAAWILAFWMGYDIYGIWASLVIFSALQGFLSVRKYMQGRWKTRKI